MDSRAERTRAALLAAAADIICADDALTVAALTRRAGVHRKTFYRHWVTTGKAMPLPRLLELSGQLLEHGAAAVARR